MLSGTALRCHTKALQFRVWSGRSSPHSDHCSARVSTRGTAPQLIERSASVPATSTKVAGTSTTPPLAPTVQGSGPDRWETSCECTDWPGASDFEKRKRKRTRYILPPTIPPPKGGGHGVRGRGEAPTPHRPIPVARAARPARAKGPGRQEAGGGALRGTHGLQRGPIGARKRRAGARSVTR